MKNVKVDRRIKEVATMRWVVGLAMVLGSFQCRSALLLLHIVGQASALLAAGGRRVGYIFLILFFICLPFLMSCLLGDA